MNLCDYEYDDLWQQMYPIFDMWHGHAKEHIVSLPSYTLMLQFNLCPYACIPVYILQNGNYMFIQSILDARNLGTYGMEKYHAGERWCPGIRCSMLEIDILKEIVAYYANT